MIMNTMQKQQKKSHRLDQINEFIKHKFAEIIRQELELPDGVMVSVTRVRTSADLRHAKVGISIYPEDQVDKIFAEICRNLKKLKYATHQQITFKYAPDIKVFLDKQAQEGFAMDRLLDKIKEKNEAR